MAFIDDSDLRSSAPQPQVVYQQAPKGKLVPILLVVLIIALVALTTVMALPYLKPTEDTPGEGDTPQVSAADLDPEMLMTPTGRKLDVIEFGGFLFEITRIAYSDSVRARTVTVTVPGKPPQMGVFHVNESFAGGKIRIVDITRETVVFEANGSQQMFTIPGADPSAMWDRVPPGMQIVPPSETGAIPNIPAGQTRPPKHPLANETPEEGVDTDGSDEGFESLEDLPYIIPTVLRRDEYQKLVRELPAIFENDMVLHTAFERDTRQAYGLEIKNIMSISIFYTYGIQRGDVIVAINDEFVRSISDLTTVARSNAFRDEIRIDVERESGLVTFVFEPGIPD